MAKYFHRREKLKRRNNEEEEEISESEIKNRYLKRVSHVGIYDLHDYVKDLQKENEENKKKINEL